MEKLVTLKQVGLKPEPVIGGANIGLVDEGMELEIVSGWSEVTITSGPMSGSTGWLHSKDVGLKEIVGT